MRQELQTIVKDVSAVAQKHKWSTVLEMAESTKQAASGLLLTAPDGCDTSEFQSWLAETVPGSTVERISLQALAQKPAMASAFEKIVVVFTCGVLIKGEQATAVQTTILNRPAGSYAIVMSGARSIQSANDLAIIERGVRRLFLAYLLPNIANQQDTAQLLQEHNMYLWDRETANADLQDRLQQDRTLLSHCLTQSMDAGSRAALDVQQVRALLQQAESALAEEQREQKRVQALSPQPERFMAARREISALRDRIRQLMQSRIGLVRNKAKTSLETLQVELLTNLHGELQQQSTRPTLRIDLKTYIMRGLKDWERKREQEIFRDAENDITREIDEQVREMARVWQLVTEETGEKYPEALLAVLPEKALHSGTNVNQSVGMLLPDNTRSVRHGITVVGALSGGGLGGMVGLLSGGTLIIPLAGAGALVGGVISNSYETQRYNRELAEAEAAGELIIRNVINEVIERVIEHVERYGRELQQTFDRTLTEIEDRLGVKARQTVQGSSVADAFGSDVALLQSCRQRFNEVLESQR